MLNGQTLDFVVVDQTLVIDAVLNGIVELAGGGDRSTVGQVTAVRQAHAEDGVTSLQQRQVNRRIGLGTGVRLNVGVIGTEQLLGTVNGQLLNDIDILATTVVALARVAFGVLVGQDGPLRLHNRRTGVVLRGNQLDVLFLTYRFLLHGSPEIGIECGNIVGTAKHVTAPC